MYRYLIEMLGVNFKIVIQVFVCNKILCFLIVSKAVLEFRYKRQWLSLHFFVLQNWKRALSVFGSRYF